MYRKMLSILKSIILKILGLKIFRIIPDDIYIRINYLIYKNKICNLKNPKSLTEKLQWIKLYDRNPSYIVMVDKYAVRKYISETLGEEYLIPLLGVWEKFDDIDFNSLPNQFVLKCNHDSGSLVICKDKSSLNIEETKRKINKCLKRNYYYHAREWPYKNVKPKIICEKYMVDESGIELKDYKLMCFNGKVKYAHVCLNRYSSKGFNVDFYDPNWKPLPFEMYRPRSDNLIPKPKTFDKMIQFAEKLSKDIPYLRVDFYEVDGKLYFGELTFFPCSGFQEFKPKSYDYVLGSFIELPPKGRNYNE